MFGLARLECWHGACQVHGESTGAGEGAWAEGSMWAEGAWGEGAW